MSFKKSGTCEQKSLFDCGLYFNPKQRELLDNSWAKVFSEDIFPAIDETVFAPLYSSDSASRPNSPVNVMVGALILEAAMGLTDVEVVQRANFDYMFRYALHTTDCEDQPLSVRTLVRFRKRCCDYAEETGVDLIHECVKPLSEKIAALMGMNARVRRMD